MTECPTLLNRIQVRYSMEEIARALRSSRETLERVKYGIVLPRGDLYMRILAMHDAVMGSDEAGRALDEVRARVREGLKDAKTRREKHRESRAHVPRVNGKFVRAA